MDKEIEELEQEKTTDANATEEEKVVVSKGANDIVNVFAKMKEATQEVKSFAISGVATTTTTMAGITREETVEISDMIDEVEITGSIKMYISKDTYVIVKQETKIDSKVFLPLEMNTVDEGVYTITNYNQVNEITIL